VDGVGPAFTQVRAFDDRRELVLAHPRPHLALERAHGRIGEAPRDPEAVQLFGALHHAEVADDVRRVGEADGMEQDLERVDLT